MTLKEAQDRCNYWVERLSMGEWRGKVTVYVKSAKDMEAITGRPAIGGCWWSTEECKAEIYLLRGKITEGTLLHEILHILLEGHCAYPGYNELIERTINRLVTCLLSE